MKDNPLEGREIRMGEGLVYEPYCYKCKVYGFGFSIVLEGRTFDKTDVAGACCIDCGSEDLEWHPAGYSSGEVVMEKGWKRRSQ